MHVNFEENRLYSGMGLQSEHSFSLHTAFDPTTWNINQEPCDDDEEVEAVQDEQPPQKKSK